MYDPQALKTCHAHIYAHIFYRQLQPSFTCLLLIKYMLFTTHVDINCHHFNLMITHMTMLAGGAIWDPRANYNGNDIGKTPWTTFGPQDGTPDKCLRLCRDTAGCYAVLYDIRTRDCYVKRARGAEVQFKSSPDHISGMMVVGKWLVRDDIGRSDYVKGCQTAQHCMAVASVQKHHAAR
jgi:hypothetical protein